MNDIHLTSEPLPSEIMGWQIVHCPRLGGAGWFVQEECWLIFFDGQQIAKFTKKQDAEDYLDFKQNQKGK